MALDTFVAEYEGDTLTLDIKDEIMDALYEVDGTIDYDAYEQDLHPVHFYSKDKPQLQAEGNLLQSL